MNSHKPKFIDPYLPVLNPNDTNLHLRIVYDKENNIFKASSGNDTEAENLIKFLGFNKNELAVVRAKHIIRIKDLLSLCDNDDDLFLTMLASDKNNLSFATALEEVFSITLSMFIDFIKRSI